MPPLGQHVHYADFRTVRYDTSPLARWKIPSHIILDHFPAFALTSLHEPISLPRWSRQIAHQSHGLLHESSALSVLRALFNILRNKPSRSAAVASIFALLESILDRSTTHYAGLSKVRRYFATLAAFTCATSSTTLGGCLLDFFWTRRSAVTACEDGGHLSDWSGFLGALRGVVSNTLLNRALEYLARKLNGALYYTPGIATMVEDGVARVFERLDRGRRRERWAVRAPRARTLPPVVRYPRLLAPTPAPRALQWPAAPGWGAYQPPNVWDANDLYRDAEMDALRAEQQYLHEKVNYLEVNQHLLGEEMLAQEQQPRLQLGWV